MLCMTAAARRESIPITEDDATMVERLMQVSSLERLALAELSPDLGDSKASVLHALLSVGIEAVRERAREAGYRALLAEGVESDGAEIRTARRRQIEAWSDEE